MHLNQSRKGLISSCWASGASQWQLAVGPSNTRAVRSRTHKILRFESKTLEPGIPIHWNLASSPAQWPQCLGLRPTAPFHVVPPLYSDDFPGFPGLPMTSHDFIPPLHPALAPLQKIGQGSLHAPLSQNLADPFPDTSHTNLRPCARELLSCSRITINHPITRGLKPNRRPNRCGCHLQP